MERVEASFDTEPDTADTPKNGQCFKQANRFKLN